MQDAGEFDIIVTGAGSAGCAVAGRLAEGGRFFASFSEATRYTAHDIFCG